MRAGRIEQLDSIRGLAALLVVFSHIPYIALSFPFVAYRLLVWLGFNNGHNSVILFFVLSGFVLSIPLLGKREQNYLPYLVKRYFRIYIPYIVAIIFSIALSTIFINRGIAIVDDWEMLWNTPISISLIFEHIILLGNIHSNEFNGVIWSLIHELRISIIFPFLVLFIKRFDWKVTLIVCLVLSCISGVNNIYELQVSNGYNTTYFHSIQYTALFLFGSLIAKHRNEIIDFYREMKMNRKWLILIFALFMFNFSEFIVYYLYGVTGIEAISTHFYIIVEYGMAFGCIGIMISAMGSRRLENILLFKPLLFLGKISYSLYLYHLPVFLVCIYLLHTLLPLWIVCIIAILLSVIVSSVAWVLIEKPSNYLGRSIAKKMSEEQSLLTIKKTTVSS
jgi:peptidoglycan/LPS O-acetylase OafA/YrhL